MSPTASKKPSQGSRTAPAKTSDRREKSRPENPDDHQGATDEQVSNQTAGSGAGYDLEPKKVRGKGGVET
jgi:hypothetical protein